MTIDEAIALAHVRVPVTRASDQSVCEVRLQIGSDSTNVTVSRDTFLQVAHETDFYGCGRTPVEAIMNAISDFENCPGLHSSGCALHNMPALPQAPCDCGAYPSPEEMLRRSNSE